jgi:putative membrane protein
LGIWTDALIRDLFDRLPWLGWAASAAAAIAAVALLVLIIREIAGMRRLAKVAVCALRHRSQVAIRDAPRKPARS